MPYIYIKRKQKVSVSCSKKKKSKKIGGNTNPLAFTGSNRFLTA
jgi:hypothetical protein